MTATFSGKIYSAESNRSFALERTSQNQSGWEAAVEVALTQSRLLRTASCQVLNICRGGDATTSLGSLFQHSTTRTVRTLLLTWNSEELPVFQFVHIATCSFTGHHWSWSCLLHSPHGWDTPKPSFLQAEQPQLEPGREISTRLSSSIWQCRCSQYKQRGWGARWWLACQSWRSQGKWMDSSYLLLTEANFIIILPSPVLQDEEWDCKPARWTLPFAVTKGWNLCNNLPTGH